MKEFIEKLIGRLEERKTELANITAECKPTKEIKDKNYGYYTAMNHAISIVNQLAEEYNNGWILCSEKLPEENEEVILTFKNSVGLHVGEATYKNRMFFYVTDTEFGYYEEVYKKPIAWKPKDKPYQPKGE